MRWSVEVCVVCVALWCARAVPVARTPIVHRHVGFEESRHVVSASEATVMNVDLIQTVAVIGRLTAPGVVESVELDTKNIGSRPVVVITMKESNGNIRKDYIVLDGLVVEPTVEGIVRLGKASSVEGVEF